MNEKIFEQLAELALSFGKLGIKPVICGGLGVYLCFYQQAAEAGEILRVTTDVDLMLTKSQVLPQSQREAIAEIITGELNYVVSQGGQCFRFEKSPDLKLDILTPLIKGLKTEGGRTKLVKARLHGRLAPEAEFIEEDLRAVSLSYFLPRYQKTMGMEVHVPAPTNMFIMKLFAFDDRDGAIRKNQEHAQAHAWDIYTAITLTNRNDYLEGQNFLSRHKDSEIIQRAKSIVAGKFSAVAPPGWQYLLAASSFYPNSNIAQKRQKLNEAARRLARWFDIPEDIKRGHPKV